MVNMSYEIMGLCGLIDNIIQIKPIEGIQYNIHQFTSYGSLVSMLMSTDNYKLKFIILYSLTHRSISKKVPHKAAM